MKQRKAIMCFIRRKNEVLFIYDNYPTGSIWNGISGFIDEGEKAQQAAVREVKEEIGLDIDINELNKIGEWGMFTVFEIYKWKGEPKPMEEGITEIKWFNIEKLPYKEMHEESKNWFPQFFTK